MQKLKPCPFCLGKNVELGKYDSNANDRHSEYAVYCMNCGVIGPNDLSEELASEMWNLRRIEHPEEIRLIEFFELRKRQPERGVVEVWNQVFNAPANNEMDTDFKPAA